MNTNLWLTGLIPAVFTPMHRDGRLNLEQVPTIVEHLIQDRATGIFVCGTTGEGMSLSSKERRAVTAAYVEAIAGRLPVIVQVGHNSLAEAGALAADALRTGATAIAAAPPSYFKPQSLDQLIGCLNKITSAAPELPFYYYHIPSVTGVHIDLVQFLQQAKEKLPTLMGVKYSAPTVYEMQACVEVDAGRFNILFGVDEMLLSGLSGGADGAVGSTYNFAAPLYHRIIEAFERGHLDEAQRYQALSAQMARLISSYGGLSALKAMMKLIDLDCGSSRLPFIALEPDVIEKLRTEMQSIGFFDWGRNGEV